LAQDGKVISVRLALFAEMVKGRPWTPATLKEVGGTEGVGVTFLEETFAAATAPPPHRLHQRAAQAVLKALLPETGTDIKGHMRSRQQLLDASGYADRPGDFEALLRVLDGELRLITPIDSEGTEDIQARSASEGDAEPSLALRASGNERYYQLTHDYLVPSLRDWLSRKQKETRRGRAELRLAEQAALWHAKPESRHLPAWWEWANIRFLTRKRSWTPPQQKMMRRAGRYHALRGVVLAVFVGLLGWGGWETFGTLKAQALRDRLVNAETADVPLIVADMAPYRRWLDARLQAAYAEAKADNDARKQLHVSLALLPVDPGQVEYLYGRLLSAGSAELPVIRDALRGHQEELVPRLWQVVGQGQENPDRRFRAACVLAGYDAAGDAVAEARWDRLANFLTDRLLAAVQRNPSHYALLLEMLRPVGDRLLAPLGQVCRDRKRPEAERSFATSILAEYAADRPEVLADLLADADERAFGVLLAPLRRHPTAAALLEKELGREAAPDAPEAERVALAKRQATAAAALLRLGQGERIWRLFRHSPDPTRRSYLVQRLGPLGVEANTVVERLEAEADVSARRALVLALGEYGPEQLPPELRQRLVPRLLDWYRNDPDPGLHGAIDWLLRHSKEGPVPRKLDWGQAEALRKIDAELRRRGPGGARRWYVNGQGQTMVLIPGPVAFRMGSPASEPARRDHETPHRRCIVRSFAIASKSVTIVEFERFLAERPDVGRPQTNVYSPDADGPMIGWTWYMAARYCNWLSEKEGLPESEWCYPKHADIKEGMKPYPDYLKRTGYRLPTEAEWEYACRAETTTARYYGRGDELLLRYAWSVQNARERAWPVGQKRPNDLGLFDMHGNVWAWCQEGYADYPSVAPGGAAGDEEDNRDIVDPVARALRGGSFASQPSVVRSAYRGHLRPSYRNESSGLRPARTCR
jgi:formylglycine-generating enzyme required for sulfatase activity